MFLLLLEPQCNYFMYFYLDFKSQLEHLKKTVRSRAIEVCLLQFIFWSVQIKLNGFNMQKIICLFPYKTFFQNKEYRSLLSQKYLGYSGIYGKPVMKRFLMVKKSPLKTLSRLPQARLKSGSKRKHHQCSTQTPISGYHLSPLSAQCLTARSMPHGTKTPCSLEEVFHSKTETEENRMVHSLVTKRPLPFKQNFVPSCGL